MGLILTQWDNMCVHKIATINGRKSDVVAMQFTLWSPKSMFAGVEDLWEQLFFGCPIINT